MSSQPFEAIASELDYPMLVVTVSDDVERSGCLVGFSTQCTINPPRYVICLSKKNRTADVAARSDTMVLHVLRPGDESIARLFGEETGEEIDKFEHCRWRAGPGGAPIVEDCDWFAGRVRQRIDAGDHVVHLLDVLDDGNAERTAAGQLGFQALRDLDPGHSA
jgi:flavin reductase (DIM6/NTAB) family NADH-FMN oxidoreductase RutF